MKLTILPAIGTDWCVADTTDGELPIVIESPRELHEGEIWLLIWRFYQDICNWRWHLDHFKHLAYITPFWLLISALGAYLRLKSAWEQSPVVFGLFGWVTFWLVCDGVWLAIQELRQLPQWWRARKVFATLKQDYRAHKPTVEINKELALLRPYGLEHHWIKEMAGSHTGFEHLYARLLRRYPPRILDYWPAGLWRHLGRMILGVPVREPFFCYCIKKGEE